MKKLGKFSIFLIILLIIYLWLIWDSSKLTTTFYDYQSERVPSSFDGFKIVQLSDIHCKSFGSNNQQLIDSINSLKPDIILITGDCIDQKQQDLEPLEQLFSGIADTAPIYAISGNHEFDNEELYAQLLALYNKYNITDIDDNEILYSLGNDSILIKGLGAYFNKINWDYDFMKNKTPDAFSILLDHYPQLNQLSKYHYDMILSGHVHGGIIRLPILGGLLGNRGELFPEYSGGVYELGDSTMYVSRGLGDTVLPRINNNPEVVCITLHSIKPKKADSTILTASALINNITVGFNLGNSLDSCPANGRNNGAYAPSYYETQWGNPVITKEYITAIKAAGFNAVRIPVTWYYNTYVSDSGTLTIREEWLDRVAEVTDYALENDMYVILNSHHDEDIIWADMKDLHEVSANLSALWTQIAIRFQNYNHQLIFEGFNEINSKDNSWKYNESAVQATNQLNQLFVDTIRKTGGQNTERILLCGTYLNEVSDEVLNSFVLPTDTVFDKLLVSVHSYDTTYNQDINTLFERLHRFSERIGAPVIISEFGSTDDFVPLEYRSLHAGNYVACAGNYNIKCFWWDNGDSFALFNRLNNSITEPDIISALINPVPFETQDTAVSIFDIPDSYSYASIDSQTGELTTFEYGALTLTVEGEGLPVTIGNGYHINLLAEGKADGLRLSGLAFYDAEHNLIEYTPIEQTLSYDAAPPSTASYMRITFFNPWGPRSLEEYTSYLLNGELKLEITEYTK